MGMASLGIILNIPQTSTVHVVIRAFEDKTQNDLQMICDRAHVRLFSSIDPCGSVKLYMARQYFELNAHVVMLTCSK